MSYQLNILASRYRSIMSEMPTVRVCLSMYSEEWKGGKPNAYRSGVELVRYVITAIALYWLQLLCFRCLPSIKLRRIVLISFGDPRR